MAEKITIARPYAKAVFADARDKQRLPQWSEVLRIAAQVASDERVAALFGNPHVESAALAISSTISAAPHSMPRRTI
jgi:F-type H+-transporting ATPase subunit delta